jgi:hypothetical protein
MMALLNDIQAALAQHFDDGGEFEAEDYLHAYGDPRQALLLCSLFLPQFLTVSGHVVLASCVQDDGDVDRLREKLVAAGSSHASVLDAYRRLEVPYVFSDRTLSLDQDELLAGLLARSWGNALAAEFPDREWVTEVLPPSATGSVVGLCFREAI